MEKKRKHTPVRSTSKRCPMNAEQINMFWFGRQAQRNRGSISDGVSVPGQTDRSSERKAQFTCGKKTKILRRVQAPCAAPQPKTSLLIQLKH